MSKKIIPEAREILREISIFFAEVDGELRLRYPRGMDYAEAVFEIDTLTKAIIKSRNKLFSITTNRFNKMKYIEPTFGGRKVMSAINTNFTEVRTCFIRHEFSPRFELFYKHTKHLEIKKWLMLQHSSDSEDTIKSCEALNGFINAIREEGRSASFKSMMRRFERCADKNDLNLYRYLRKTLTLNGKINLCRYDIAYRKIGKWPDVKPYPFDQDRVKKHRDTLIKAIRKEPLSKFLIGYAWKMEQSAERGFQHHLLLILEDESLRSQDAINHELNEAWDSITGGKGLLIDCGSPHNSVRGVGTGLIDNNDNESWKTLRKVCHYMTQADRYIKLKIPKGRTFGKAGLVNKKKQNQKSMTSTSPDKPPPNNESES